MSTLTIATQGNNRSRLPDSRIKHDLHLAGLMLKPMSGLFEASYGSPSDHRK
jgi:hypothetical protein